MPAPPTLFEFPPRRSAVADPDRPRCYGTRDRNPGCKPRATTGNRGISPVMAVAGFPRGLLDYRRPRRRNLRNEAIS